MRGRNHSYHSCCAQIERHFLYQHKIILAWFGVPWLRIGSSAGILFIFLVTFVLNNLFKSNPHWINIFNTFGKAVTDWIFVPINWAKSDWMVHAAIVCVRLFSPAASCGLILYFYTHKKSGYHPNMEVGPMFNHCQIISERWHILVTKWNRKPCQQNVTTTCRSNMQDKLFNETSPQIKSPN